MTSVPDSGKNRQPPHNGRNGHSAQGKSTNGLKPGEGKVVGSDPPELSWIQYLKPNRKLVLLKIFMLFYYGGFSALYPYLVIHMRSLGITVAQTGLMYTIYPLCVCIGGPLAGVIGDKSGRYKLTLIIFLVASIFLHTLLCFAVPAFKIHTDRFNESLSNVDVTFFNDGSLSFFTPLSPNATVTACPTANITSGLYLDNCQWSCPAAQNDSLMCFHSPDDNCSPWESFKTDLLGSLNLTKVVRNRAEWNLIESNELRLSWNATSMADCVFSCSGRTEGNLQLPCSTQRTEGHQLTTFGIYLAIRLACGTAINLAFTLIDASLIQMVEDYNGDIGINRAFAYVGFCIVPPLSGLLIDYASQLTPGFVDYRPAFYIFAVSISISVLILCFMELKVRPPAQNVMRNAAKLLRYPRVLAFVAIFSIIGVAWGFLETFLFWLLEDLKVPKWLLGFTNTVGGLAGVPFAMLATTIIKYTGYTKIFIFGLFVFGLRFIGYSVVNNIAWVLPLECLEAFTSSLPMTAASIYASTFSADLLATLQGVNAALHFGIGRGAGSLAGGLMIDKMGTRAAFRIFGFVCMAYAFIHALLHCTWLRKLPKPRRNDSVVRPTITLTAQDENDVKEEILFVGSADEETDPDTVQPVKKPLKDSTLSLVIPMNMESWGSFLHIDAGSKLRPAAQVRRRAGTATGAALLPHSPNLEEQRRKSRHHSVSGTSYI
ncbi:hypothetical protein RvY_14961 [Ramazzottius varieornatus]|uniref:Major facilitator superfamily associated domain-containing protein n=1 Tax=Ramazzottius varieornatus TaxID=947166 RepID=A0A1D1VT53_RAMVA|nr:hypothetical protein RvY_14961 [Ramazzottius varieornatus]